MTTLPNPWLTESSLTERRPSEAAACADRNTSTAALLDFPLRDEPLPLFLTEPAPVLDRELEAMLRVIFGVVA